MTREKSDEKEEREKREKETKPTSSHKEEAHGGGVKVETTTVTKAKVDEDEGDDSDSSSTSSSSAKRGPGRPPMTTEHGRIHPPSPSPSHPRPHPHTEKEKGGEEKFTFVLKRQGEKADKHSKWVQDLTTKKPNERNYATPDEFEEQLGFTSSDVKPILKYASDHSLNLDATRANAGAGVFTFEADKDDFEKAFPAKGKDYTIPSELSDIVKSIHGPANTLKLKHHLKTAHGLNVSDRADIPVVFASSIASYYGIPQPPAATGKGQVIGLLEFGGGFTPTDVANYFKAANISPAPSVVAVSVDGTQNSPGKDTDSDGEVNLDIDVAAAIAPGAKIVVYFAANSEQGFIEAFNYAITDKTNAPDILSISWGGPENSWSANGLQSINQAAQSASTLGISIFAASGDAGSGDGERGNNVDFPGSSPYICDVGGTSLSNPESAWNDKFGASGGGVSSVFPKPSWQTVTGATPPTPAGGRECPDVSFNADPNTGYTIVADGQQISGVGGTSAAAPGWAGVTAIANQLNGKNVGFLNPLLYANPSAFKDITVGNNGAYQSGTGYDNVTGLGSPTANIIKVLSGTYTPPPLSVSDVSAHTSQGTPVNLVLAAIINKAGAAISRFNIVTQPTSGSLAIGATVTAANTISVTYTPSTGFVGTDSFTFNAVDSAGDTSNTATVNIAVTKTASGPNVRIRVQETPDLTSPQPTEWNTVYTQPPVMMGNAPPQAAADGTQVSKSRMHGPEKRTTPKQEVKQQNVIK